MTIERMLKELEEAQKNQTAEDKYFWDFYHETMRELDKINEAVNRLRDFMMDIVKMRKLEKKERGKK